MINYINNLSSTELIFLIIGFLGQGLFASRFIVQWIYSEKQGKSSIPVVFWYLSRSKYGDEMTWGGDCSHNEPNNVSDQVA